MSMIADLFVKLGLNSTGFNQGIDQAKQKTSGFGQAVAKIGPMISGIFAVGAIIGFVKSMVGVRSEFEKYEAVLTNTLGSATEAKEQMQMLKEVAASTPFALTELTGAFVKLTNYGLKPSRDELIRYGDLASSVGKGFDQLAEAAADAVTGQYERLKEFGIKASKEGSKVTFTFKEQAVTVGNSAKEIKNYLVSLGGMKGVAGSMGAQMDTLGGKISNFGDSWDNMLNTLGEATSGLMKQSIGAATDATNELSDVFYVWGNKQISFWKALGITLDKAFWGSRGQAAIDAQRDLESTEAQMEKHKTEGAKRTAGEIEAEIARTNRMIKAGELDLLKLSGTSWVEKSNNIKGYQADLIKLQNEQKNIGGEAGTTKQTAEQLKEIEDARKKAYDTAMKNLNDQKNAEQVLLTEKLLKEQIGQQQFDEASIALDIAFYNKEAEIAKQYGEKLNGIQLDIINARLKQKNDALMKGTGAVPVSSTKTGILTPDPKSNDLKGKYGSIEFKLADGEKTIESVKKFNSDLNDVIKSGMSDAAMTFGEGIGALLSGDMNMEDFGLTLLSVVGKFLTQFGQLIIAYAVAAAGLEAAIKTPGAWPIALAAGIALVAIGSLISNASAKGLSGSGSSGGGSSASSGSSYGSSSGGQSVALDANVNFVIQGNTLQGVLNNNKKRNSNIG